MLIIEKGKGYDTVSKTFRLPKDMVNTLKKLAQENNLTMSELAIQCLNYAISDVEQEKEKEKEK